MTKRTPVADYAFVLQAYFDELWIPSCEIPDPAAEVAKVASVVKTFALDDLKMLIDDLKEEPLKIWPSPGEWVSLLQKQFHDRTSGNVSGKGAPSVSGFNYQQILNSKQGVAAKAKGKPHTFLQQVLSGEIPLSTLDFLERDR